MARSVTIQCDRCKKSEVETPGEYPRLGIERLQLLFGRNPQQGAPGCLVAEASDLCNSCQHDVVVELDRIMTKGHHAG